MKGGCFIMQQKRKSHLNWSWILMVSFFSLAAFDIRFGLLGFICMTLPVYHAVRGKGKIHCSHYCPRGSFLGKFLGKISANKNFPEKLRTNTAKNILLGFMVIALTFLLIKTGVRPESMGLVLVRFFAISSVVAVFVGLIFKPRTWCQICPMGHLTGIIAKR